MSEITSPSTSITKSSARSIPVPNLADLLAIPSVNSLTVTIPNNSQVTATSLTIGVSPLIVILAIVGIEPILAALASNFKSSAVLLSS